MGGEVSQRARNATLSTWKPDKTKQKDIATVADGPTWTAALGELTCVKRSPGRPAGRSACMHACLSADEETLDVFYRDAQVLVFYVYRTCRELMEGTQCESFTTAVVSQIYV